MLSFFESLCNESGASIDVRLERVSLIALVLFLSLLLANGSLLTMPTELVAIKARTLGGTPINFPYVCFSRLLLDGSPCPLYAITCDSCNRTLDALVLHGLAPCSYNGFRKEIMASFSTMDFARSRAKSAWNATTGWLGWLGSLSSCARGNKRAPEATWGQVGPKCTPSGPKVGQSAPQVDPKSAQVGAKWSLFGPTKSFLGPRGPFRVPRRLEATLGGAWTAKVIQSV